MPSHSALADPPAQSLNGPSPGALTTVRSIDLGWHGLLAVHAAGKLGALHSVHGIELIIIIISLERGTSLASLSRGCRGPLQATIQNWVWGAPTSGQAEELP